MYTKKLSRYKQVYKVQLDFKPNKDENGCKEDNVQYGFTYHKIQVYKYEKDGSKAYFMKNEKPKVVKGTNK